MHMRRDPLCGDNTALLLPADTTKSLRLLLSEEQAHLGPQTLPAVTVDSPVETVCADPGLQQYLKQTKFALHPCEEFRAEQEQAQRCAMFTFNLPPANEVSGNDLQRIA